MSNSTKTYRVYNAFRNSAGGVEGCGTGSEEFEASSAEEAARMAADEWDVERGDWDGGDVIVATDDEGDSFHLCARTVYRVSDGNAAETADSLSEAEDMVSEWYDFLVEQDRLDELPDFPGRGDDAEETVEELMKRIGQWEAAIAEALGCEDFHGHGRYSVAAADQAGLDLNVEPRLEW